jgi:hypothetical protein
MKKRLMFIICACLSGLMAHAEDYPYLTFRQADGTLVSIPASSLAMTFVDGKLVATYGTESRTLTVAELESMYFSKTDATGIKKTVATDANGQVEGFTLQGVSLGKFDNLQSLKKKVPAGVYIVKANNGKTSKVDVK